jgi:hemerythrin-like domain-containing protein
MRRAFVRALPFLGAASLTITPGATMGQQKARKEEEEVSTNEDLMREHGILKRVLLAYDEIIRRIRCNKEFPPQAVTDGAIIIRKFIEDYHEKLEEDHWFPPLSKSGQARGLVDTLYTQHQGGQRKSARFRVR